MSGSLCKTMLKAHSPQSTQEVELNWTVENLRALLVIADQMVVEGDEDFPNLICVCKFKEVCDAADPLGDPLEFEVSMRKYVDNYNNVRFFLNLVDVEKFILPTLWITLTYSIMSGRVEKTETTTFDLKLHQSQRTNYFLHLYIGDVHKYLDSKGSFNLHLKLVYLRCSQTKPAVGLRIADKELHENTVQHLRDFEKLLEETDLTDIELKVKRPEGERSLKCHKTILGARSPVFRAMFNSTLKESREKVVVVEDISFEAMEHFIHFVYCGRFKKEEGEQSERDNPGWVALLPELIYAAEKYDVQDLKAFCDANLSRAFTTENSLEMGLLIKQFGLITSRPDWISFVNKHP